ncbi:thylakoid lumenal 17.9 kDa protein, chloroplastic [Coffea eugenioides]|uniref:thylakoid lumenal 17.9 kDa protein, chloroplastic n=1 Tax=Coffea eugenioides TaxID=49369 RepID=UPI000F605DC6|nr:thylakoid lumenal 17.9 kDa protein, chloroplastic [Coffea eugenioides]
MALKFNGQLLLPSYPKFPTTDHLPIKVSACHPPFSDHRLLQLHSPNKAKKPFLLSKVLSLAIAITLSSSESPSPSLAIPALNGSQTSQSPLLPTTTPFSQAKNLPIGLENGKIRPCPSINPGCVSTNPNSASFAFPWVIPESSSRDAIKQLEDAILMTQKNVKIQSVEDTPYGKYLQAEVDGGFSRDVLEFLVKGETTVTYRAMATKVTYVYPFTTAFGDSKGQEERMKQIVQRLGWYAPNLDFED